MSRPVLPRVAWRRRVFIGALILLIEFAALEAALRFFSGNEAAPAFQSLFMDDPGEGYRLKPNARATYTTEEFSTVLAINAQGVRDDEPIGPKAPNERRVVVLGDSLVLSVQVPFAETFCHDLETRLNAVPNQRERWRVINAGVQGYGPVEQWLFYEHIAAAFEPDVVLVVTFVGNAAAMAGRGPWIDADGRPPGKVDAAVDRIRRITRRSMVWQQARLRYDQLRARVNGPGIEPGLVSYLAVPPPQVAAGLEVSKRAIGLIVSHASKAGARTGIVLMPARFQTDDADFALHAGVVAARGGTLVRDGANVRYRDTLAPLGVPMFDLLPVLEAQPDRKGLFFQRNVHLTTRGHQVVADALFQFLESSGLSKLPPR